MEKKIAACGNDCMACPRYVAHPWEKTDEQLRHTAELWMKIGYRDHIVTNEEISCRGCKPENWCRYQVVKCCQDRGIKTCADCQEYPCDNMKECFQVTKSFEPKCREVCSEEEYLQLKRAFFEKEENLGEIGGGSTREENVSSTALKWRITPVNIEWWDTVVKDSRRLLRRYGILRENSENMNL